MPCFTEVLFPPNISRGAKGGPRLSTVVVASASGFEQRIAQWAEARRDWDVSHALRNHAQRDELLAFFIAREGRFCGFRFKDWSDFKLETPTECAELTTSTFQIRKGYTSGGVTVYRDLKKIAGDSLEDTAATQLNSTVKVYESDGTTEVTSGWAVDLTTGIVTFDEAPGYGPKATCEFHVPVRFDTDAMAWSQDEVSYGSWNAIPIVELRLV